MEMKIDVPDYTPEAGLRIKWLDGFVISVNQETGITVIKANKNGLVSLAVQFLTLAQDNIPPGVHIHFDDSNSLENGSSELIIERI